MIVDLAFAAALGLIAFPAIHVGHTFGTAFVWAFWSLEAALVVSAYGIALAVRGFSRIDEPISTSSAFWRRER